MTEEDTRPRWLQLLHDAQRDMGGVGPNIIATRSGVSRMTVYNTLKGYNTPRPETMRRIVAALLREDSPAYAELMDAYSEDTFVPPSPYDGGGGINQQYTSRNKAIGDALRESFDAGFADIAEAIRDVAAAIREQHVD